MLFEIMALALTFRMQLLLVSLERIGQHVRRWDRNFVVSLENGLDFFYQGRDMVPDPKGGPASPLIRGGLFSLGGLN
jgi:hypothetical protein